MNWKHLIPALTALAAGPLAVGDITIGTDVFSDNAFADEVISSSGSFRYIGHAGEPLPNSPAEAVLGSDINTGMETLVAVSHVELGFIDNVVVNGPGPDLVFFELSSESFGESIRVALDSLDAGVVLSSTNTDIDITYDDSEGRTGSQAWVYRAELDLSSLGVPDGASIDSIYIDMSATYQPDLLAVGAIPAPGVLGLLASTGLLGVRRRRG
jgi:hypothetical protein